MNWIWVLLGGLLTGIVAKALLYEKRYGIILTTLVGIIGGFIGSWIARHIGWILDRNLENFLASVIGAVLFLAALRILRGRDK